MFGRLASLWSANVFREHLSATVIAAFLNQTANVSLGDHRFVIANRDGVAHVTGFGVVNPPLPPQVRL